MKAEQFIKDCTRRCSNVVYYYNRNFTHGTDYIEGSGIEVQYSPWLTPDQALRAVEIAREEIINTIEVKEINSTDVFIKKVENYLNSQLYDWVSVTNPDQMSCANIIPKKDFIEDFKNYMKGE